MKPLRYLFVILTIAAFTVANFSTGKALTSSLVEVTNFGTNPSHLGMFVYIPTTVKANPPILVVVHWCTGSAQAIFPALNLPPWLTSMDISSFTRPRHAAGTVSMCHHPRR